jgi:hypothetical protein
LSKVLWIFKKHCFYGCSSAGTFSSLSCSFVCVSGRWLFLLLLSSSVGMFFREVFSLKFCICICSVYS